MSAWRKPLKFDPVPLLLASDDFALRYFARRDLLGYEPGDVSDVWKLSDVLRMLRKQNSDGAWHRTGGEKHPAINYRLIETWKNFRFLIDQYQMTRRHPQIERAAEFFFSCQTNDGDIRGMLANQYATYYTGAIMSLLIKAGYENDRRIEKGFRWLLSMRQADGGWTIPLLTHKLDRKTLYRITSEHAKPLEPDRSKPFSHNWTGMVLRAFAAHPKYRRSPEAKHAGELLKSRFFKADAYSSYHSPDYWIRFDYPFWWSHLVSSLDSLSRLGFSEKDAEIKTALEWLRDHQGKSGGWKLSYIDAKKSESASKKGRGTRLWLTLAICRVFKKFYDSNGAESF